jgi:cytochrome c oxidase subunit 2
MWPFTPPRASTFAGPVDTLYYTLIALSLLFSVPVAFLIVYFGVKYRRGSRANRSLHIKHMLAIEMTWSIVPLFLALGVFAWGATLYFKEATPPADALEVYVIGKQWMWKTQHPGGQREINQLHVPIGRPIKLLMTSQDVIHSFYVPAFRIKQDVLPGRYTVTWFEATQAGEYPLNCAEFCGTDHAVMGGSIIALDPSDYEQWLHTGNIQTTLAAGGERLFREYGCSGCHGLNSTVHAPNLAGIFGNPVPLENGQIVTADEQYIRDSILLPQQQIAAGYPPIMPSFQGQISEDDLQQLIEYIKSLGQTERMGNQP